MPRKGSKARGGKRKTSNPARKSGATGTGRKSKPKPRAPLSRAVAEKEAALKALGKDVVARRVRVGETRWLTPTRAGFGAIDDTVRAMQRASKGAKGLAKPAWSYDLKVRWKNLRGKFEYARFHGVGFPALEDVRAARRKIEKRRGRKFRSEDELFREVTVNSVIAATFRQIERKKSLLGGSDELVEQLAKASPAKVRRVMRDFKERRSVGVRLNIHRLNPKGRK